MTSQKCLERPIWAKIFLPFVCIIVINDDDTPLSPIAHFRGGHADQPVVGDDVVIENLAELIVGDVCKRPVIGVGCGIADENVDPTERAARLVHQMLQRGLVGDATKTL